ncbi:prepilin-type N-terminal cleavage/methylation domain-containing protein [Sandaracinobacter sp. RS1-74]|uniref:type II secretion system protein GspJ n=1 Tax=Sandaracinobacteroides sayramensis TaxID=2913411 RepID=UPI001EDAFED6|nr:type II secretion system protein GspJ [Sandaracinobacteroides sayramensis]MCG2842733.1 prepilin-type N-terminal cleavage/methylation domain-containing protein [Sandaracinobacteroides sayramensis]
MKAAATKAAAGRSAGFTLVEMLVAVLLFGLIASIATTLTIGATRSFAATDGLLSALSNLEGTRAVLAADLGQAARRPSLAADGKPMPAFLLLPEGFVLVRRGVGGTLPNVEKVAWGFDGERLLRQSFPAIDGAQPGPATVMLPGVSAIRIRVASASGWQDHWQPSRPEDLPQAVEITLVRADGLPVVLKFLVAA